jgi:3-methyladenine DNA glycosylase AlkD
MVDRQQTRRRRAGKAASAALLAAIRQALRAVAEPDKAGPMQAYMKSTMPYLGVQTPAVRSACRAVFSRYNLDTEDEWRETTLALWRTAGFREERYAAIELTGYKTYRTFQTMAALPLYEEMVTTGAWWDYVDVIAIHRLGGLLRHYRSPMRARMQAWANSPDIWKRRSAILCQLSFKRDTDLDLLYECIEASIHEKEFFLRKAIGWALREHSKTDGREVLRYVKLNRNRLSPLSKREALKVLLKNGGVGTVA